MTCQEQEITRHVDTSGPKPVPELPKGVPPLNSLYFYLCGECNLACRHCWIAPEHKTRASATKVLPVHYARKAISEAIPLGLSWIKLTGGEPLLHPRFKEIVELAADLKLGIVVETNGTLIDEETAKLLAKAPGPAFVSVSVDGARQGTHDQLRGVAGSFDDALRGLDLLVHEGLHPQLICSLHRGNREEATDVVALARERGCGSVKFNRIHHAGRGDRFIESNGLATGDILELYRVTADAPAAEGFPVFFDIPMAFRPIRGLLNDAYGRCALHHILGILSDGTVSLCGIGTTVPELVFGHLDTATLSEIWLHNETLTSVRETVPDRLTGVCGRCIHRSFCLGNCVADNYHLKRRIDAPYSFCEAAEEEGLFPESRKRP